MTTSLNHRTAKRLGVWAGALAIAAALFLLPAAAADASTTLDPDTGTGFVGKGDLQLPWVWSDAQLQANYADTVLTLKQHQVSLGLCEGWSEATRNKASELKSKESTRTTNLFTTLAWSARSTGKTPKVTGINLSGLGDSKEAGDVFTPGEACQIGNVAGKIVSITVTEETTSLLANYTTTVSTVVGYTTVKGKKTPIYATETVSLPELTLWVNGVSTY